VWHTTGYKKDLRFFSELRELARRDAQETVAYGAYEDQIRRMVDQQVIGTEVREIDSAYLVHRLGIGSDEPEGWSREKARNEADMIRTRLKKTIEQELVGDPYAQKVFAELLKRAIAEAAAMFDHPLKQYALLNEFEKRVEGRELDGVPNAFGDNAHARAYFGICRMVLGEEAFAFGDSNQWAAEALDIDRVVNEAVAEHSLNPQNIEMAIRQSLLPRLFAVMGLEKAKEVIEQVIQVTRVGLSRGSF
jgi:type I restriction enzyme R subunit